MSFTSVLTFAKTSKSPDDAFETMPVLEILTTPEQAAAHRRMFPSNASIDRTDPNKIVTTVVYPNKEIAEAQAVSELTIQVMAAKDAWVIANDIDFSITTSEE